MLSPDDAPPEDQITDVLFEISRTFAVLSSQFERAFVVVSDSVHGSPEDS
jgi:hypothetical protein